MWSSFFGHFAHLIGGGIDREKEVDGGIVILASYFVTVHENLES